MSDATTVRVRGEATRRVAPDRATVRLNAEGRGADAPAAVAGLRAAASALDAALDRHDGPIVAREASRIAVRPHTWYDARTGEQRRDGFVAARSSSIEVVPATAVAAVIDDVTASVSGIGVDGPWWSVDPGNPVHVEVRAAAATDARGRAEAYAAGLGATVGAVVRLAEPGLGGWAGAGGGYGGEIVTRALAADAKFGGGEGEEAALVDVGREQVEVVAAVEVEFRLS